MIFNNQSIWLTESFVVVITFWWANCTSFSGMFKAMISVDISLYHLWKWATKYQNLSSKQFIIKLFVSAIHNMIRQAQSVNLNTVWYNRNYSCVLLLFSSHQVKHNLECIYQSVLWTSSRNRHFSDIALNKRSYLGVHKLKWKLHFYLQNDYKTILKQKIIIIQSSKNRPIWMKVITL